MSRPSGCVPEPEAGRPLARGRTHNSVMRMAPAVGADHRPRSGATDPIPALRPGSRHGASLTGPGPDCGPDCGADQPRRVARWTGYQKSLEKDGWGARIRTWECRYQKPVPYHLATPQPEPSVKTERGKYITAEGDATAQCGSSQLVEQILQLPPCDHGKTRRHCRSV